MYDTIRHSFTAVLGALAVAGVSLLGSVNLEAKEVKRPKIISSNIYERSDILVYGKKHTLIPKTCALHVPDAHKAKFKAKAEGAFERFSVFFRANYNWLTKYEVTLDQAKGKAPLDKDKLTALKRTGKVVVAVYKNNPISVKKYVPPKEKESK